VSEGGKIHQNSTLYLSKQQSTPAGCYNIADLFSIWTTKKNAWLSGVFFQDFPDLKLKFTGLSRSWNFQEKIQDSLRGKGNPN